MKIAKWMPSAWIIAALAAPAWAQQAAPQAAPEQQAAPQAAPEPPQEQLPVPDEGFFRPADDPALTSPAPANPPQPVPASVTIVIEPAAPAAQIQAREALERDLAHARAHDQARAEAAQRSALIVSPLDGTAPIVSPLDR